MHLKTLFFQEKFPKAPIGAQIYINITEFSNTLINIHHKFLNNMSSSAEFLCKQGIN